MADHPNKMGKSKMSDIGDLLLISRDLSEFSLRARPKPVSKYQAGVSELSKTPVIKKVTVQKMGKEPKESKTAKITNQETNLSGQSNFSPKPCSIPIMKYQAGDYADSSKEPGQFPKKMKMSGGKLPTPKACKQNQTTDDRRGRNGNKKANMNPNEESPKDRSDACSTDDRRDRNGNKNAKMSPKEESQKDRSDACSSDDKKGRNGNKKAKMSPNEETLKDRSNACSTDDRRGRNGDKKAKMNPNKESPKERSGACSTDDRRGRNGNKKAKMSTNEESSKDRSDACSTDDRKGRNGNKKAKMNPTEESQKDRSDACSQQGAHTVIGFNIGGNERNGFPTGTVVWGKILKSRWWPGIVFEGPLAGKDPSPDGRLWILWFGDLKITQMRTGSMEIFSKHFRERCSGNQSRLSKRAILQTIKVCSARASWRDPEDLRIEDYDSLVESFNTFIVQKKDLQDPSLPKEDEPLPDWILSKLEFLKEEGKSPDNISDVVDKKCFSCRGFYPMVCQHPLFEADICKECKILVLQPQRNSLCRETLYAEKLFTEGLQESLFTMDDDGSDVFCCICCFGSEESVLYVCSSENCKRSFCSACLEYYLNKELYAEVKHVTKWICVLCKPYQTEKHGLLKPKPNHRTTSLNFINSFQLQELQLKTSRAVPNRENRDKLRVISIGDGIGTLKLVLDVLKFDIDRYYSSEINENAILVSSKNHGSSISQIGNVSPIARERLKFLRPIDLIVFTPPEPSLKDNKVVGPLSADTDDTADKRVMLLLKCITLVKDVQTVVWDRPFFYLIESTTALPNMVFTTISNILETEPCLYNCEFSVDCPYIKPRLYWTNIPGVHRGAVDQVNVKRTDSPIKLDWTDLISNTKPNPETSAMKCDTDAVSKESKQSPHTSRKTRNRNRTDSVKEVQHSRNNQDAKGLDNATSEKNNRLLDKIERSLGFPDGYTRVAGLSTQQRAVLMKDASCPHLLTQLLRPLTEYFKCN